MIQFILGPAGSGKSTAITEFLLSRLADGRKAILLVPEQEAVIAERRIAACSRGVSTAELEVLNFRRLANRVFRSCGGLSAHYIGKAAKTVLMWRAAAEAAPLLSALSDSRSGPVAPDDPGMIARLLTSVSEFKSFRIRPSDLESAADALQGTSLGEKTAAIATVYAAYETMLHAAYDDPEDVLTVLADTLSEHDFFRGYTVCIDSFRGFTPQEFEILRAIFRQADEVRIAFPGLPDDRSAHWEGPAETREKLRAIALETGRLGDDILLTEPVRYADGALKKLSSSLYDYGCDPYDGDASCVTAAACADAYEECETVARMILRGVREGARYRDYAVSARDIRQYQGILDAVFEKYGIPLFLSRRTDLTQLPLYRLLLSALTIVSRGWQTTDVITYLRTGMTGLSPEESDTLEDYLSTWRPGERRWREEDPWTLNPNGYSLRFGDAEIRRLEEINRLRDLVRGPLFALSAALEENATVRSVCTALIALTVALGIPNRLQSGCDHEGTLVWNTFCKALDELVEAAGELPVTASQFAMLLSMAASQSDYGRIPAAVDSVTAGSAPILRCGNIRHMFLLGMNEEEFPKKITEDGLFSEADRFTLSEAGVPLDCGGERRTADELLHFYSVVTAASESVTLLWAESDLRGKEKLLPSSAVSRVRALLPGCRLLTQTELRSPDRMLEGRAAARELLLPYAGTPEGDALRNVLSEFDEEKPLLEAMTVPVSDPAASLGLPTLRALYPGDIRLSQSRLDTYAGCPFAYGCEYLLGLKEHREAAIRPVDTGSFLHDILEKFASWYFAAKPEERPGQPDVERFVDRTISDYLAALTNRNPITKRTAHLIGRLRRTALILTKNLIDEFSNSDFVPCRFELPMDFEPGSVRPPEIPIGGGRKALLFGKIDRCDVYRVGSELYVRVIDYKTGSKTFSASDLKTGINLQLLLYLFALSNGGQDTLDALGYGGEKLTVRPAGALYYSAKAPDITHKEAPAPENAEDMITRGIKRSGLLLRDPDIMEAMEHGVGGRFLPIRLNSKNTDFCKSDSLKTLEEFGALAGEINEVASRLGSGIRQGQHAVRPLKTGGQSRCRICAMKPVCRYLQ